MDEEIKEEITQSPENLPVKNKKPWLIIVLIVLLIVSMGTAGILGYQNYLLKNQIQLKKDISAISEISPTLSPINNEIKNEYEFNWDEESKKAIVLRNNKEIISFNLSDKPINVLLYIPKNILGIAAEDKNLIQHLFIYKDEKLTKIYSGEKFNSPLNPEEELSSFIEGDSFSPNGDYLLVYELWYEASSTSHLFSLKNLNEIEVDSKEPIYPIWHPQDICFLDIDPGGMFSARFNLIQIKNGSTELKEMGINEDLSNSDAKETIWWEKENCSGIVKFKNYNDGLETFYKFGPNLDNLELTDKNLTNNLQLNEGEYEKFIYFIRD